MDQQQLQNDEVEIDLRELFYVLKKRILIIIGALVAGVVIMAMYTLFLVTPLYSSSSMLYVLTTSTSITSLADIQLGSQLTNDYAILIKSRPVLEEVIQNLELDIKYEELVEMIDVNNPSNTRVLYITVTHPVPQTAQKLADEAASVTSKQMAKVMSTESPNIAEYATLPEEPVSPSLKKNCAIGGLLAMILAIGIIVVVHLFDDTIKSEDDIEKYLQLTTLGIIPVKDGAKQKSKPKSVASNRPSGHSSSSSKKSTKGPVIRNDKNRSQ